MSTLGVTVTVIEREKETGRRCGKKWMVEDKNSGSCPIITCHTNV
jgi:hypothetical protein